MLVVSRERINQAVPVVKVIPLTSRKSDARCMYPNEVPLPAFDIDATAFRTGLPLAA